MPLNGADGDRRTRALAVLRDVREKKERGKMRQRFWELGGSRIGKAMGLDKAGDAAAGGTRRGDEEAEGDGVDFRAESQFASHLKKSEAVSDFARSKTIAQQRRYLPVYQVRARLTGVRAALVIGAYWSAMHFLAAR